MTFDELYSRLDLHTKCLMKNCLQDPKYHSEGSVYNHSKLVYDTLVKNGVTDMSILISALFHDLGKLDTVKCYEKETGIRIQSIGHENYASGYIAQFKPMFSDLDIDWFKVKEISKEHMNCHKFLANEIKKAYKRKFFEDREYIVQFAKADNEARTTENGKPFVVASVGIPGSGKSTWRNKFLSNKDNWKIVCPDDIRKDVNGTVNMNFDTENQVWTLAYNRVRQYVSEGFNVVFDSTMLNIKTQTTLESLLFNKAILCYKIFTCDKEIAKGRIHLDIENNIDRSNVTDKVVDTMFNNFDKAVEEIYKKAKSLKVYVVEEKYKTITA